MCQYVPLVAPALFWLSFLLLLRPQRVSLSAAIGGSPFGLRLHLYSRFGLFSLLSSLSPGAEKHNDCRFLGGSKVTRSRATKRHEKW